MLLIKDYNVFDSFKSKLQLRLNEYYGDAVDLNILEYCMRFREYRKYVKPRDIARRWFYAQKGGSGGGPRRLCAGITNYPLLTYFILCYGDDYTNEETRKELSKIVPLALDLYFRKEIEELGNSEDMVLFKYYSQIKLSNL